MTILQLRDALSQLLQDGTDPDAPLIVTDTEGVMYEYEGDPVRQVVMHNAENGMWQLRNKMWKAEDYAAAGYMPREAILM